MLPRSIQFRHKAFVDPSGGSSDSFCLAIAHNESPRAVKKFWHPDPVVREAEALKWKHLPADGNLVLDRLEERRPPFNPESVVKEFAAILNEYGIRSVRGDRYGGLWPTSLFETHGISYEPSEIPKSQIYQDFLPILNARRCELLDNPRLVSQLCSIERRTSRSGKDSIDHEPNAHDDLANVCAGVLTGLSADTDNELVVVKLRGL